MKKAVLSTGTFDPYHLGHLWQLERGYRTQPFDKAIVTVVKNNPKKPNATDWRKRVAMAELMFANSKLPFTVEVKSIDTIEPNKLKYFINRYLSGYYVVRTMGSDGLATLVEDSKPTLYDTLTMCSYAVYVRPLTGQQELEKALAKLPSKIAKVFSYKIIHIQQEDDIAATDIRKDPFAALEKGYITQSQLEYIQQANLYQK